MVRDGTGREGEWGEVEAALWCHRMQFFTYSLKIQAEYVFYLCVALIKQIVLLFSCFQFFLQSVAVHDVHFQSRLCLERDGCNVA